MLILVILVLQNLVRWTPPRSHFWLHFLTFFLTFLCTAFGYGFVAILVRFRVSFWLYFLINSGGSLEKAKC